MLLRRLANLLSLPKTPELGRWTLKETQKALTVEVADPGYETLAYIRDKAAQRQRAYNIEQCPQSNGAHAKDVVKS